MDKDKDEDEEEEEEEEEENMEEEEEEEKEEMEVDEEEEEEVAEEKEERWMISHLEVGAFEKECRVQGCCTGSQLIPLRQRFRIRKSNEP